MLGLIVLLQALTLAVSGPATSPEYLPIWVASADGQLARQGLKVTLRPTRSEVGAAEALAQGQADLVATSVEAAPPVVLLVDATHGGRLRRVEGLAGVRVGITAPGAAEHAWLNVLLARARLTPTQVQVVSAAVFVRADRRPGERELAAFTRAILAAEERLAASGARELSARQPRSVVGTPDEFDARVLHARGLYLPGGRASAEQLDATVELFRDQLPLPARARIEPLPPGRVKTTPGR